LRPSGLQWASPSSSFLGPRFLAFFQRKGAPFRGQMGHLPAGSRSHPRPPQVPLASLRHLHPLARGVDIIARDYVKVTRSVTRRREPARARSDKTGLIGSRCKSRDRLA
jgi:hypothetical protein